MLRHAVKFFDESWKNLRDSQAKVADASVAFTHKVFVDTS